MQDIRAVWPCLVKPAQRYIACFETLAQLALLQATHSHIGGGHYSFSMPSGTDNSATEASLNKLFTTSWPLQLFVQLKALLTLTTCCCSPRTFQEGAMIGQTISAEVGWPDSAIALKVACASALQAWRCQAKAFPGVRNIWQQRPSSQSQPSLHSTWPSAPFSAVALSARTTGNVSQPLAQAALTRKKCSHRMPSCSQHSVQGDPNICPARYNPTLKGG